jgi:uncharacterized membrane protein
MDSNESDVVLTPTTDKWPILGLAILVVYSALQCLIRAVSKPLWYDEICTWTLAHQPGPAAIWNALQHAADSNPPGYYLIERTMSRLIPNQEIALRIPSIIGFCCVVVCLFAFVRKRSGSAVALCCAAIPLMTVFYDPYAVEARPYMLVTACVSIAMVCYQRAPAVPWMLLMGFSLAVSQMVHYYTVFMLVPFGIAEFALFLKSGRVRWTVWLALVGGFLPFIPCWPLLKEFGKYYGSHFWAKPSLLGAESVYGWFLNIPYALGIGLAAASAIGTLAVMMSASNLDQGPSSGGEAPMEEYVLVIALIGLPFIVYAGTKISYGAMTERYVLPASLGIQVAAGYILPRFGRKAIALFALVVCFALVFQEVRFWHSQVHHLGKIVTPATYLETMVDSTQYSDLPVVVSDGIDYPSIAHYASPELARRVVAVVDVPAAIAYCGSDSVDLALLDLRSYMPLQVYDFSSFASEHSMFLLYSTNQSQFDWWPSRFVRDGDSMTVVALEKNRKLYLVKLATRSR